MHLVTHCHDSILCRRSHEAPTANRRQYRDATLKMFVPDLTVQLDSCVNVIGLKLIRIAWYKLIKVHSYFMNWPSSYVTSKISKILYSHHNQ